MESETQNILFRRLKDLSEEIITEEEKRIGVRIGRDNPERENYIDLVAGTMLKYFKEEIQKAFERWLKDFKERIGKI